MPHNGVEKWSLPRIIQALFDTIYCQNLSLATYPCVAVSAQGLSNETVPGQLSAVESDIVFLCSHRLSSQVAQPEHPSLLFHTRWSPLVSSPETSLLSSVLSEGRLGWVGGGSCSFYPLSCTHAGGGRSAQCNYVVVYVCFSLLPLWNLGPKNSASLNWQMFHLSFRRGPKLASHLAPK